MIRGVLFVCVGNLCRSPMAEGWLRHVMPDLVVTSAGLHVRPGQHADPFAITVMQAHGIDISAHRTRALNSALHSAHDLVLVMDKVLQHSVLNRYPYLRGRVHVLADEGIADPYQLSYDVFEDCQTHIATALDAWQPRLRALAQTSARYVS